MDVFLMIRRKKLTIFTDAKETTTILELKKIIEGILKVSPKNQQLFKDHLPMEDEKTLLHYGLTSSIAKAQCPGSIGLTFRLENGEFEPVELTPFSSPPDLPEVMKSDTNGQEQSS
ncbi:elongin-B isoform X3 [Zootermopsis nevadensis]|uniref:Elongin-B n=1 Tax=Zootermopsis nevadensis TaxID=136037 RepID=A0A067R6K7_ZOONE|nr:elongin-B isoform X2 [Zootermopsis nevadensis]XP_021928339.1 elongin-B isoform X3 [Zootermopsis nevadensis]KDR15013.1 Transcription elongation factor B polypeptide 2 [Zootermopsis nevadensis]